jgi:hypothetical protein
MATDARRRAASAWDVRRAVRSIERALTRVRGKSEVLKS